LSTLKACVKHRVEYNTIFGRPERADGKDLVAKIEIINKIPVMTGLLKSLLQNERRSEIEKKIFRARTISQGRRRTGYF